MPKTHVVEQGECLSRIARRYGFRDYRLIYEHPDNARLRQTRPNPNILHPGDTIVIPDKREKTENCATGRVHRFKVPSSRRLLRIALEDVDGNRLGGCPYTLTIGEDVYTGTLPANGLLEKRIAIDEDTGTLEVTARGKHYQWPLGIAWLNPPSDTPDEGITGIQARLRNLGFDPGPIDGIIGPKTRQAIRAFQAKHPPLAVDGICGPKTRAKLIERHGC